ncbi:MAG: cupredoxin domain-containing protein [Saprospiraceae bacterium]
MKSFTYRLIALALVLVTLNGFTSLHAQSDQMQEKGMHKMESAVTLVQLTQTPGEFNVKGLTLDAGDYTFEVTNDGVDHEVGFVVQKAADRDADMMKTAIKSAFTTEVVAPGATQRTGVVSLTPGEYLYFCPMNPTPKYTITVK